MDNLNTKSQELEKQVTAHWLNVFESCRQSGLTQKAFCEKHKISLAQYKEWRARIHYYKRSKLDKFKNDSVQSTFIPVVIQSEEDRQLSLVNSNTESNHIIIKSNAGSECHFPADMELSKLLSLINHLFR